MALLSPWYLLGLLGVGIPLAIHLIRRQRAEHIVLPTVRFLKKAPKKLVRFQKIQQWLLLALRVAMVGLVALAFARPVFTGAYPQLLGGMPKSLAIALDTSMSMRYGDHFQKAKAAVISLLQSLQPEDEAAVITFSDRPGAMHPLTTDHAALEAFVKSLPSPGYHATRYLPVLRLADQMLRSTDTTDKSVYLISDFRRGPASGDAEPWPLSPGLQFKAMAIGDEPGFNLAVTDVSVQTRAGESDFTHTVIGRIQHFGNAPAQGARVSLEIDNEQVSTESLNLEPGSQHVVSFPITVTMAGVHGGMITVQGDGFIPDNQRFFTFRIEPPLRVLLLTDGSTRKIGTNDPTVWMRSALAGQPGTMFQVDNGDIRDFRVETLASYAGVVLMDINDLTLEKAQSVISYVKGGGGLLLAPADGVDGDRFNSVWEAVSPALLHDKKRMPPGASVAITRVEKGHPILRGLQKNEPVDFSAARFREYWVTEATPESEEILAYESGNGALLTKTVGNGRSALFTSSLDPTWNNFPRQVMFLPLMHEVMRFLAGRRDQNTTFLVGEIAPLVVPGKSVTRIVSPQGLDTLLQPNPMGTVFFDATEQPGFYDTRSGSWAERFAVNVSPVESDLNPMTPEAIQQMVMTSDIETRPPDAVRSATMQTKREAAQQNWWWLLLGVLLLGFVETYLANRTYR